MYILNFLKELTLLNKAEFPKQPKYPKDDTIYYGYTTALELKEQFEIDATTKNGYHLVYASKQEPFIVNTIDVTDSVKYLNKLRIEIDSTRISEKDLFVSIYEAIWLFDLLMSCDHNFFDAKFTTSIWNLSTIITDNSSEEYDMPAVQFYEGVPLEVEIDLARFMYFIKIYVKVKHNRDFIDKESAFPAFTRAFKHAIGQYTDSVPITFKSETMTKQKNLEFDDFIQQIYEERETKNVEIQTNKSSQNESSKQIVYDVDITPDDLS